MIKLKQTTIENFKGIIEPITVEIADDVFYIIGSNGSGKSSLIDALLFCITGSTPGLYKKDRWQLKRGKKPSKVSAVLHDTELGCDITVKKKITKGRTEVKITATDGMFRKNIDAEYIESLLSQYTWDLTEFIQAPPEMQAKMLNIDTSEYDAVIAEKKEIQSDANKAKLHAMRAVKDLEDTHGKDRLNTAIEKIDTALLAKTHAALLKQNFEASRYEEVRRRRDAEINRLNDEIKAMKHELNKLYNDRDDAVIVRAVPDSVMETVEQQMKNADSLNALAAVQGNYIQRKKEQEKLADEWDKAVQATALAEDARDKYLSKFSLPAGAEINSEGELTVPNAEGGQVPLKETHLNTAKAFETAIAVLQGTVAPEAPIYIIRGGGLFDRDDKGGIPMLKELHDKTGAQIICELVSVDKPKGAASVKLSEGKVSE